MYTFDNSIKYYIIQNIINVSDFPLIQYIQKKTFFEINTKRTLIKCKIPQHTKPNCQNKLWLEFDFLLDVNLSKATTEFAGKLFFIISHVKYANKVL